VRPRRTDGCTCCAGIWPAWGNRRSRVTVRRSRTRSPAVSFASARTGSEVEVVADGFRNAYSSTSTRGEPFTYDSTMSGASAPWYEPCRFYQRRARRELRGGGRRNCRRRGGSRRTSRTWCRPSARWAAGRRPAWRVIDTRISRRSIRAGSSSQTGRSGRIHFVPLTAKGSTWTGTPKVFAEAMGENGVRADGAGGPPEDGRAVREHRRAWHSWRVYRITHDRTRLANCCRW